MKVISLLQPWATLVVIGAKTIETRSWTTAYRGLLLIHASKGKAGKAVAATPFFKKYIPDFNVLPFGAIIGSVQLTNVQRVEQLMLPEPALRMLTLEEKAFGDYSKGRYAWELSEATAFRTPLSMPGSLGLWTIPDNEWETIMSRINN